MRFNRPGTWGGETMSMHQNKASQQSHVVFHVGNCQGFCDSGINYTFSHFVAMNNFNKIIHV